MPNVLGQAASFSETLPDRLQQLRSYALGLEPRPLQGLAVGALDSALQAVQAPQQPAQQQIVEASATAAHSLLSFFTVFVLAYYWLVERASLKRVIRPGAFLAVPLAGALQVVLAHVLRNEDPSQAEEHADPVDRAAHQGKAAVNVRQNL